MANFVYNKARTRLLNGEIDLDSHTFKAVLLAAAHTPGQDSHEFLSEITADEIGGSGYVTGGWALTSVTLTRSTTTVTFDAADLTTPGLANAFRYVVIYDDSHASKALLCLLDPGSLQEPGGAAAVLTFNASGIMTLGD